MGSINNLIIDPVNAAPDHVSDAGQVNQQLARLVETGRGVILAQWTARGCTLAGSGPMANRLLAVDASLRDAWQGFSNDEFDQIVGLGLRDTGVPVGAGRAIVAGAAGVVRDDSWVEVFEAADGVVAIVQAADPDHPDVLARALGYPDAEDDDGETLRMSSGQLAIFSAAADGGRLALGAPARCPA